MRSLETGKPLRRTAEESQGARLRNKLIGKTTWFKQKKTKLEGAANKKSKGARKSIPAVRGSTPSTVIFVEQTPQGELAQRLRDLFQRLEPTLGFTIKTVERTGATLRSKFPLYNLWEGAKCGRRDCIPCDQGAEFVQLCTKNSVVYENICLECNPGAEGKKELRELVTTIPTAYIGETSRSIKERTKEHWGAYSSRNKESHMLKHQELQHGGAAPPKFIMRVISSTKTALERQTREAVRIRRRGGEGAILNSKAEFNRCYIPRLQLEEQDIASIEKEEQQEIAELGAKLDMNVEEWIQDKQDAREQQRRKFSKSLGRSKMSSQSKHPREETSENKESNNKRRKYELVEPGWGAKLDVTLNKKREPKSTSQDNPKRPLPPHYPQDSQSPELLSTQDNSGSPVTSQLPPSYHPPNPPPPIRATAEDMKDGPLDEILPSVKTVNNDECNFKRGVCQLHNVKGVKNVISSKKWGKLKNGLNGWLHSKKVKWTCKRQMIVPEASDIVQSEKVFYPDTDTAPIIENNQGISDNSHGVVVVVGVRESDPD